MIFKYRLLIIFLSVYIFFPQVSFSQNLGKLELPSRNKGVSELIIEHEGYTLSYNKNTNTPNWVAWELTAEETQGTEPRSNDFLVDPKIPRNNQVTTYDYRGSGYDRGHMCPAGDMKWSREAMTQCFYMSNMCPQNKTLNGGPWEKLESSCRRWAKQEGKIYIVCGPIFTKGKNTMTIGNEHRICIPDAFFKVVLSVRKGHEKAIGFIYKNDESRQTMGDNCCSVDEVEKITGYDFFPSLNDDVERTVESSFKLSVWN